MSKLIKNWEELAQVPANDKYKIIIDDCCGWIVPIWDERKENHPDDFICHCNEHATYDWNYDYFNHHVYLSTHTFYGSSYKYSTETLQKYGFDVEIDNWDKEVA